MNNHGASTIIRARKAEMGSVASAINTARSSTRDERDKWVPK